MRNVAIEMVGNGPEISSVGRTDQATGVWSGIDGLVFVGSTFQEAKADALQYLRSERDRLDDGIANLRDLRAKDVGR